MDKKLVYLAGFGLIIITIILAGILLVTSHRYETTDSVDDEIHNTSLSVVNSSNITIRDTFVDISYELELTELGEEELSLIKVEVLNKKTGEILKTFDHKSLEQIYSPGTISKKPTIKIAITLAKGESLGILTHQVYFISEKKAMLPFSIKGGEVRYNST